MAEIYALIDPRDGVVRYIGKANDSAKRFKGHLGYSRRHNSPVCLWLRELAEIGEVPQLSVLEVCEDWQSAERRLIAEYRSRGFPLLNVVAGGNQPLCPIATQADKWLEAQNGKWELHGFLEAAAPLLARVILWINRKPGVVWVAKDGPFYAQAWVNGAIEVLGFKVVAEAVLPRGVRLKLER